MTARGALAGAAAGLLGVALAAHADPLAAPGVSGRLVTKGDAVIAGAQCNVCHVVPGHEPAARTDSCHTCHVWIREVAADPARREKAMSIFPLWERYERNVATYMEVPSLEAAMARLDPAWVRTYLADPHDLRPHLPETMPRLGLDADDLDAVAAVFAAATTKVPKTPAPNASRVAEGAALFTAKGCTACHTYGALHTGTGLPTAPDLAHTRERMKPDLVAAWIQDPKTVSAAATMPSFGLTETEALALRDYVLLADPSWKAPAALGPAPTATKDPVGWAQVEERVFGKICQHCHMNPDLNQGRMGPGNAGGFGWPATGIELQTYEGVVAVADRLPDALLRRRDEARRDAVGPGEEPADLTRPAVPGMPLGLPPLSDEDIALVLGWIEQGTPR